VLAIVTLGPPLLLLVGLTFADAGPEGIGDFLLLLVRMGLGAIAISALYTSLSLAAASLPEARSGPTPTSHSSTFRRCNGGPRVAGKSVVSRHDRHVRLRPRPLTSSPIQRSSQPAVSGEPSPHAATGRDAHRLLISSGVDRCPQYRGGEWSHGRAARVREHSLEHDDRVRIEAVRRV